MIGAIPASFWRSDGVLSPHSEFGIPRSSVLVPLWCPAKAKSSTLLRKSSTSFLADKKEIYIYADQQHASSEELEQLMKRDCLAGLRERGLKQEKKQQQRSIGGQATEFAVSR